MAWAKEDPGRRRPTVHWMIKQVERQLTLQHPVSKTPAPMTLAKHVTHWLQTKRSLDDFDKNILRKIKWVLKLAEYHDTHATLRAVKTHLKWHPLSRGFLPDLKRFLEDPQAVQAFLDRLRPENDPSDPAYRPSSRK